ncbi:dihydroorotate dehydrogenase-like protein [Acetobacter cerevisiae]|uniref:Diguanylate cyclase n=1 Tax=Acetobacter cerevisiae TaxID=178900 RepID=A0A149Q7U4_9PROT|nr:dihydroorotate dehydrogenase-like protein [Acetobacter cerevisiae]KXU93287.1 diguanylate cyclase [Acetobacter cerevisiae]GBQ10274.1 dihydroorotate dehydrogenase [Acetobacter cerevisiae DSM 14362]
MNLETQYLGLSLRHPIVASASPLTADLDHILRVADAGAAAIVMASIFEEEIAAQEVHDAALFEMGEDSHPDVNGGYFPAVPQATVLDGRLSVLRRAAERAGVPVIASLNGCTQAGWVHFARKLEQAGAAAIELNFWHIAADPEETGTEVEERFIAILKAVKAEVSIPVSIKLPPFFSAPGNMAKRLVEAGAAGLVLFNRFYEPGLDLHPVAPEADAQLSTSYELRLPLIWTGLLSRRLQASFAVSGGVNSGEDVVRCLLAGADVAMVTSALLRHGSVFLSTMLAEMQAWMEARSVESVAAFKGQLAAHGSTQAAETFLRDQYRRILSSTLAFGQ